MTDFSPLNPWGSFVISIFFAWSRVQKNEKKNLFLIFLSIFCLLLLQLMLLNFFETIIASPWYKTAKKISIEFFIAISFDNFFAFRQWKSLQSSMKFKFCKKRGMIDIFSWWIFRSFGLIVINDNFKSNENFRWGYRSVWNRLICLTQLFSAQNA